MYHLYADGLVEGMQNGSCDHLCPPSQTTRRGSGGSAGEERKVRQEQNNFTLTKTTMVIH